MVDSELATQKQCQIFTTVFNAVVFIFSISVLFTPNWFHIKFDNNTASRTVGLYKICTETVCEPLEEKSCFYYL